MALAWGSGGGGPVEAARNDVRPVAAQTSQASRAAPVPKPRVGARSAILIDGSDGRVLWEKDPHRRQAVASTAKILTALVVLERAKPDDMVTASTRAELVGDADPLVTQLNLTAGERLPVEQLLYGLLLTSANDAAVALAEHVGGSVDRFAGMMNSTAKQLGAKDSHFTNANGLDDPGQYSSAHDLALFAREAMSVPLFRKIVATRSHSIRRSGSASVRSLDNRNQLLGSFPGAIGIKTGQTLAAGKSLVAAARRGKEERIAVVLASPDPVRESGTVLEYGLDAFRRFQLAEKSRRWGEITYGDGTTARLIALESAGTLLQASQPNPRVFYDPRSKTLRAGAGRELRVPVKVECLPQPCRLPPASEPRALPALVSVLAPLLTLAR